VQNSFLDGKGLSHSGKYATTGHAATSRKKTPNALSKIRICARIVRRVVNVTRARATRDRMSVTHFCSGRRDNTQHPPTPPHSYPSHPHYRPGGEAHHVLRSTWYTSPRSRLRTIALFSTKHQNKPHQLARPREPCKRRTCSKGRRVGGWGRSVVGWGVLSLRPEAGNM
jgi:hypothetical protein